MIGVKCNQVQLNVTKFLGIFVVYCRITDLAQIACFIAKDS